MYTGELILTYSSGTEFRGNINFSNASVPHYNEDGSVNTFATEFTGRDGYFEIPNLEFGETRDFQTTFGYETVNRTDNTIFWPLENLKINSPLFLEIFNNPSILQITTIQDGTALTAINNQDGTWNDSGLDTLYKNSYYIIIVSGDYKLLIPSVEKDGNGIVKNNFAIDETNPQEWLSENKSANYVVDENDTDTELFHSVNYNYYYPVTPKINKFGQLDTSLGYQDGIYDPLAFELNIENIVFQTEGEQYYQGTIDDPTDDVRSPKIPFGSPGRFWFRDDIEAPITNKEWTNKNQILTLDFEQTDERIIQDLSGNSNYGELISDFSINYDTITREASTDGIKDIESVDDDNDKKAY